MQVGNIQNQNFGAKLGQFKPFVRRTLITLKEANDIDTYTKVLNATDTIGSKLKRSSIIVHPEAGYTQLRVPRHGSVYTKIDPKSPVETILNVSDDINSVYRGVLKEAKATRRNKSIQRAVDKDLLGK